MAPASARQLARVASALVVLLTLVCHHRVCSHPASAAHSTLGSAVNRGARFDWAYLERLLERSGSEQPAKNAALLAESYRELLRQFESHPFEQIHHSIMNEAKLRETIDKPINQYPDVRSLLVQLRRLVYLSETRPAGWIGPQPAGLGLDKIRSNMQGVCRNRDATFTQILQELGWSDNFKLDDGLKRKVGRLRAYVGHYMRKHYASCPQQLSSWLVHALVHSGADHLAERVNFIFRPLEEAALDASDLDAEERQKLDTVCQQLTSAIGPVIKIYDTSRLSRDAKAAHLTGPAGPLFDRWQWRYHLCLHMIEA